MKKEKKGKTQAQSYDHYNNKTGIEGWYGTKIHTLQIRNRKGN